MQGFEDDIKKRTERNIIAARYSTDSKMINRTICDTMGAIRFYGCGCGCQSEDTFVCQLACVRDLPRDQKRTRESKKSRAEQSRRKHSAE